MDEERRLIEELEAKLVALRETIQRSIKRGGSHTPEEVGAHLNAVLDELFALGH